MKPNMLINVIEGKVTVEDSVLFIKDLSPTEFADIIIDRWEHLWSSEQCNDTRKELILLHKELNKLRKV